MEIKKSNSFEIVDGQTVDVIMYDKDGNESREKMNLDDLLLKLIPASE